jgi:hypothetical protein
MLSHPSVNIGGFLNIILGVDACLLRVSFDNKVRIGITSGVKLSQ